MRIAVVCVLFCAATGVVNAQINLEWYNSGAPDSAIGPDGNPIVSGATGTSGALFQLIIASGGVIHAPTAADFGTGTGVTGGDTLAGWTFADSAWGSGVAYAKDTYLALAAAGTDNVYLRIWTLPSSGAGNLNAASSGMSYFDSPTALVSGLPYDGTFYSLSFTPPTSESWTFLAVPEPGSMALGLLGLGVILIRRRLMRK